VASPAASGGVPGGGAASGGVTGGGAGSGGVTGGGAASGGVTGGGAAPRGVQPEHKALRGRHILYAEDSIPSQKIVKRMLGRAGVQCTVVDNGEAAVHAALHAHPPFDCILMDCNIPIMDGWGATQEIRNKIGHETPIIALTANAMTGDREGCLEAGMGLHSSTSQLNLSRSCH